MINYRPPRITRKSYRPRASDRTMVDNLQPHSLSCFRIRKRRHENRMDLRRTNTPEPLNMTWAGERSEQLRSFQSPEMFFLLTLPFIERACIDWSRHPPGGRLDQSYLETGLWEMNQCAGVRRRCNGRRISRAPTTILPSFLSFWCIFGAGQGWLGTCKRNRSNDLD